MPRRRNSTSGRRLVLWLLGGAVLLAGAFYLLDPSLGGRFGEAPTVRPQPERGKPRTQQRQPARPQPGAPRPQEAGEVRAPSAVGTSPEAPAIGEQGPGTAARPRVALVVDDLGRSVAEV